MPDARLDRAERVIQWADLNGLSLADALRLDPDDDAELLAIVDDALWCAYYLARELTRAL